MEDLKSSEYIELDYLDRSSDISKLTFEIITDQRLNQSLELLVTKLRELVQAEVASVLIIDSESGELCSPIVSTDDETIRSKIKKLRFTLESSIAGWVFTNEKPVRLPDTNLSDLINNELIYSTHPAPRSILCVPMNVNGKTVGVFEVVNKREGEFTQADQYILEIMSAYMTLYIEKEIAYYWLRQRRLGREIVKLSQSDDSFSCIIGKSDVMTNIIKMAKQVAHTDANILICGDTGTGKEILARAIHRSSPRASRNFVAVNCGAIPETLLESELFGYERGAFTNAWTRKLGRFQEANGGTIFLDEIGDMPVNLQVKLLRVLEEGVVRPLGASRDISIDVRVISATHQDVEQLIAKNQFRQDLYYRLNIFELKLPPLRERKEDIPLLVEHFVNIFSEKHGKDIKTISRSAMELLCLYDYPGNVRELKNIIERAIILTETDYITIDNLPENIIKQSNEKKLTVNIPQNDEELKIAKINAQNNVERMFLINLLTKCQGNISQASREANMNRSWLTQLIKKHKLDPKQFRTYKST